MSGPAWVFHVETIAPLQRKLRNDSAVSPVVGTILMVAVTVALGATVLTIVSGFGGNSIKESTAAVFKAAAVDSDGNGKTDAIKITYVTGVNNLATADVGVAVKNVGGTSVTNATTTAWNPGDFRIYDTPGGAGSWFVSIGVRGSAVLDQTITVDE